MRIKKSYSYIGNEVNLTGERVRQIIEIAYGKILSSIKDLIVKSKLLEEIKLEKVVIERELYIVRKKLNEILEEKVKQSQFNYTLSSLPIEDLSISVRA